MFSFYCVTPSGFLVRDRLQGGRPATHQSEYYIGDTYGHASQPLAMRERLERRQSSCKCTAQNHYIGGRFVGGGVRRGTFDVMNPATERSRLSLSGRPRQRVTDIDRGRRGGSESIVRAKATGPAPSPSFRRQGAVQARPTCSRPARTRSIRAPDCQEMGGPIGPDFKGRPHPVIELAQRGTCASSRRNRSRRAITRSIATTRCFTYTMTDPAGVFGLITPWNAPIMLSTWKMAPCLAYGNSAVHKPSENSPLSIGVLCEVFEEAGLPAGVYNMVLGYGKEAGIPLVEHDDVIGVSFTGSPGTARDIAGRAAKGLKRTSFELGGKSACIVFDDADLSKAVPAAAMGIFMNSGQVCVAGSRILVQRKIYDQFLEAFETVAGGWVPGDPTSRKTRMGPLVSKAQYERVTGYLDVARQEGKILFGGGRPPGLDKGYFVEPTAIVDADPNARICQEEVFGPVATIIPFDDRDEAIAIANNSGYGLAGYIWTGSQDTAHYVSHRMQTGMIWINSGFDRDLRQPFGGMKNSGLGREGGGLSREFFTETRFASFPLTPRGDHQPGH